jgi:hypothetical protein
LFNRIKAKKVRKEKTILEKIGIGFLIFILFVEGIFLAVVPNTVAYEAAKQYLRMDTELKNEMNEIEGFSLIPLGEIQISSEGDNQSGNANLNLIVRGNLKM